MEATGSIVKLTQMQGQTVMWHRTQSLPDLCNNHFVSRNFPEFLLTKLSPTVGVLLEKAMATHSTLAWRIPGTEEPGGLQSMGLHRVGRD